jgi:pimeloyl-ACP methyl ester carboxylesterase
MDLRGHGLSDAPTSGFDPDTLASDVIAVAEGSGLLGWQGAAAAPAQVVLAGHGFGAIVASWAAHRLGDRCAGLVLVDGGFEDFRATTGLEPDEFLRGLDEPPEVMRSMDAYLADRESWDPPTWDADQEHAARAAVVETPAGRLVPATRPHAVTAIVRTMFAYRPREILERVTAPIVAVRRLTPGDVAAAPPASAISPLSAPVTMIEIAAPGHNLLRYRPDEVTAAIVGR